MSYQGDYALGETVYFTFTTTNTSGVPTQLAGTPSVAAYVDNGTTEITAGVTLTVDFDTRTGLNLVTIVATSGNGYAAGTDVSVVITAGTVGGSSVVGYTVGSFSIENRSALRPTTAGRTLDVAATGEAGIDLNNTTGALAKGTEITGFNDPDTATIADAVWDEAKAGHVGAGSFGEEVQAHALTTDIPTAAQNADAVWDEAKAGHVGVGSFGEEVQAHALTGDVPTAAQNADAVWDEARSGHVGAGSFGEGVLVEDLNAAAKVSVNVEVDAVMDTAIPVTPTADSINERVKAIDLLTEASGAGDLAAILADTADMQPKLGAPATSLAADIAAAEAAAAAAEAAVNADAISELSTGVPTSTPTVQTALMLLYMMARNQLDIVTSTTPDYKRVYNNAGSVIAKKQVSDDGSDYTEAKMVTGP